jgi:hypothetical protein
MRKETLVLGSALTVLTAVLGCENNVPTETRAFGLQFEIVGTCPAGFSLEPVGGYGADVDRNGDGYYCLKRLYEQTGCVIRVYNYCRVNIDNVSPIKGACLDGYETVDSSEQPIADQNEDQIICRRDTDGSVDYTDNAF